METEKIDILETALEDEAKKLITLKQIVDKDTKDRNKLKKTVINNTREAKFFKDKLSQIDVNKLEDELDTLRKEYNQTLQLKRHKLEELQNSLMEFNGLEPTNDALRQKIDDLKKSRLSLEMSFVD